MTVIKMKWELIHTIHELGRNLLQCNNNKLKTRFQELPDVNNTYTHRICNSRFVVSIDNTKYYSPTPYHWNTASTRFSILKWPSPGVNFSSSRKMGFCLPLEASYLEVFGLRLSDRNHVSLFSEYSTFRPLLWTSLGCRESTVTQLPNESSTERGSRDRA